MKRSEMVYLICRVINKHLTVSEESMEDVSYDLLSQIEQAGMLPPLATIKENGYWKTTEGHMGCYEWEPED